MATLTNTQISVTYVGLLKTSANTVLSSTAQQITDGSGNNSILFLSTAGVGIGGAAASGKELDVTGNVQITGDLVIDNITIDGNTITSTTADFTIDASHDIILDAAGGDIILNDNTTTFGTFSSGGSSHLQIRSRINNADMFLRGVDDGVEFNALQLDMSDAGKAIFSAGASFADNVTLPDNKILILGTGSDLQLYHDGTNSFIKNFTGGLFIDQELDDGDITFRADNGSGGKTTYLKIDGGSENVQFPKDVFLYDDVFLNIGGSFDLRLYHDGNSNIKAQGAGNLIITQTVDDGDIIFKCDDGSGGTTAYFTIDGSFEKTVFAKDIFLNDSVKTIFGNSSDLQIYHDGSNSYIQNETGDLQIFNKADDKDIIFSTDNGSGGTTAYLTLDGSAEQVVFSKTVDFGGNAIFTQFIKSNSSVRIDIDSDNNQTDRSFLISKHNAGTELMRVNEDGKVGILTSSPFSTLSINSNGAPATSGNVATTGLTIHNGSGGTAIQIGTNDSAYSYIQSTYVNAANNLRELRFILGNTTALTLDTSTNATFAGNISVSGTTFLDGDVTVGDTSSAFIGLARAGLNYIAATNASGQLVFRTGGTTAALTLDASQNANFSGAVTGTSFSATGGFLNGSNGGIRIHTSGTKFFNVTAANAARDNIMDIGASDARFKDLFLGGNITAGSTINLINGSNTRSISCDGSGNLDISNAANNATIFHLQDSALTLGTSIGTGTLSLFAGAATFAGSVTITQNNGSLEFSNTGSGHGSITTGLSKDLNIGAASGNVFINNNTTLAGDVSISNANGNLNFTLGNGNIQTTTGSTSLVFGTNSTERMRIHSSGNIGIDTTGPQENIHITDTNGANIILNSNTGAENNGVFMTEGPAASPLTNGAYLHYDSTNNAFKINTGSSSLTTRFTILRDTGFVGIANNSPSQLLTIGDSSGDSFIDINKSTSGENGIIFNNAGGRKCAIIQNSGEHLEFHTLNNNVRMIIEEGGNIGIGTTNPASLLEIYGGGNTLRMDSAGNTAKTFLMRNVNTATAEIKTDGNLDINIEDATRTMRFLNGNTVRMVIDSSGKVGIGSDSPSTLLHVGLNHTVGSNFASGFSNSNFFVNNGANGGAAVFQQGTAAANLAMFGKDSSNTAISFFNSDLATNTSAVGSITTNSSATAFNTSSDYRLKEDLKDFTGLDLVNQIPVYNFKWKLDDTRAYGVLAHELQNVLPQAVYGEKDAKEMQGVDYSKIVPLLVKSIQELQKEIEILKSK